MSGFPLEPGTHRLEAIARVSEDGCVKLTVKTDAGTLLVQVEGTNNDYVGALARCYSLLKITTGSRPS